MKKLYGLILFGYTLLLFYSMFIGFGRSAVHSTEYRYNVIPFQTVRLYFEHADSFDAKYWIVNMVGNVAVFMPFGLMLPYLLGMKLIRFSLLFITSLFVLELLQLLLHRGSFDIDDVILNTIGAWLGYLLYRISVKRS
ncbi:VanZ family protein [Paenibacillus sp. OV219]|uniref:VanZ family protein n=1 Tax=Paenibacillus sp. OV219 TaxID=1884377 RepID=UPI0008D861C9|nr:VanZ family protein [Paenibacillus sp. OV219]SEM71330.1 VanZ like family protein [Paenibacillus sp. OV219]